MKSKLGIVLVSIYILVVIGLWIYSQTCSGMLCGIDFIFVLFPWVLMLGDASFNSLLTFFGIILLNTSIFYFAGALIEWFYKRIFK